MAVPLWHAEFSREPPEAPRVIVMLLLKRSVMLKSRPDAESKLYIVPSGRVSVLPLIVDPNQTPDGSELHTYSEPDGVHVRYELLGIETYLLDPDVYRKIS